jgi:hypothetical protein
MTPHPRLLLRSILLVLALLEGGWLAFDGGRALLVGDFVTPRQGPAAGRLGPWAEVVSAIGIEPRSTFMKSIHVVLGATWLVVAGAFLRRATWSWWGMLACAAATLWYLPVGTLLSVVQIVLLVSGAGRRTVLER